MNPIPLAITLVFIIFDIVTGWLKAWYTSTTDSTIMRKGLFHKLAEILALFFGYTCEYFFPLCGIEIEIPIVTGITVYLVLMETTSIVENIATMNPQLAEMLNKFFAKKGKESGEEDGKHIKDKSGNSL